MYVHVRSLCCLSLSYARTHSFSPSVSLSSHTHTRTQQRRMGAQNQPTISALYWCSYVYCHRTTREQWKSGCIAKSDVVFRRCVCVTVRERERDREEKARDSESQRARESMCMFFVFDFWIDTFLCDVCVYAICSSICTYYVYVCVCKAWQLLVLVLLSVSKQRKLYGHIMIYIRERLHGQRRLQKYAHTRTRTHTHAYTHTCKWCNKTHAYIALSCLCAAICLYLMNTIHTHAQTSTHMHKHIPTRANTHAHTYIRTVLHHPSQAMCEVRNYCRSVCWVFGSIGSDGNDCMCVCVCCCVRCQTEEVALIKDILTKNV